MVVEQNVDIYFLKYIWLNMIVSLLNISYFIFSLINFFKRIFLLKLMFKPVECYL